jgi:hypothetical protein
MHLFALPEVGMACRAWDIIPTTAAVQAAAVRQVESGRALVVGERLGHPGFGTFRVIRRARADGGERADSVRLERVEEPPPAWPLLRVRRAS